MRIAHISAVYPPLKSGAGNVCNAIATGLAKRGYEVHVFTSSVPDLAGEEVVDGVHIHRLKVRLQFGETRFLPGLLNITDFDLIHIHFPFYLGAELAAVAANRRHIPMVITYHMDTLLRGLPGISTRLHDRLIGRLVLRAAELVFFPTLDYGRVSRASWLLESPNPARDLPNGVNTQVFRPDLDGSVIRKRLGIAGDERVVLLVAGLDTAHFFKGVPILLQAFQKINNFEKNNMRRSRLVIVGEGNLRPIYQAMMIRLGLANMTTFAGRVSDSDLPYYYAAADIGVLPSFTMGESFGIVLLEAMASAKPVVASRLPGVRTVVADGVDGYLVNPGDVDDLAEKLNKLLEEPLVCQMMGQNGLKKALEQYSWSNVIERLSSAYQEVLERNKFTHGSSI